MTTLLHLFSHDLSSITAYLAGKDILRLLVVGSKSLTASLERETRNIELRLDLFSKLPLSVFNLPSLRLLAIHCGNTHIVPYLRLPSPLPRRSQGLERLETLRLHFCDAVELLNSFDGTLGNAFPCIRELSLSGYGSKLTEDRMSFLPPTLEKLELLPNARLNSSHEYSFMDLSRLPRGLISLTMRQVRIDALGFNLETTQLLPPNLRHLEIDLVYSSNFLDYLPSTLEVLKVTHSEPWGMPLEFDLKVVFPSSLLELSLTFSMRTNITILEPLPASLKTLHLNANKLKGDLKSMLPSSITCLSSTTIGLLPIDLTLTHFPDITEARLTENALVPSNCKTLTVETKFPLDFSLVPSTLESLKIPMLLEEHITQLPKTLTSFHCLLDAPLLIEDDFEVLPPTLTELVLWNAVEDALDLNGLRNLVNLKSLEFSFGYEQRFPPTKEFGEKWPQSLTYLSLVHTDEYRLGEDHPSLFDHSWLSNLSRFPLLSTLLISGFNFNEYSVAPSEEGQEKEKTDGPIETMTLLLSQLSPTLEGLVINGHKMKFGQEVLGERLPPKLRSLTLAWSNPKDDGKDDSWCNSSHFANLPKTLGSLMLSNLPGKINKDFFDLLPPILIIAHLPTESLQTDTVDYYLNWRREAYKWPRKLA